MISDIKKTEHLAEAKVKIDMIKESYDFCCLSENIVPRRKQLTVQLQYKSSILFQTNILLQVSETFVVGFGTRNPFCW